MQKIRFIFILLIFLSSLLKANSIHQNFSNLTVLDGLSHGWVNQVLQDKQGFMWFATDDGLNKFDGKQFQVFRQITGDTNSLNANSINRIIEDYEGNIWIGTPVGLNRYETSTEKISRIDFGDEYNITNIVEIDSNTIAISTYTGLFIHNKKNNYAKQYLLYPEKINSSKNRFQYMIFYNDNLLVFTNGGVYSFNIKTKLFDIFIEDQNLFKGENVRVAHIHNNILWMGMTTDGIFYSNLKSDKKVKAYKTNINKELTIFCIHPISANQILLGTENYGIFIINPLKANDNNPPLTRISNPYNNPNGLINNSVHSICTDYQNNIWFGTFNGLSYQYGGGFYFSSITKQNSNNNSLSNNMVNCIIETNNTIWVGSENGVDIFDNSFSKTGRIAYSKQLKNSLLAPAVISMEEDYYGNVWVGTWSGGIDIINKEGRIIESIIEQPLNISRSEQSVMCIKKDKMHNMWVGTMGEGVMVFNKDRQLIKQYLFNIEDSVSLSNDWIRDILITSENEIWISTHQGLDLYNETTESFTHFFHTEGDTTSISSTVVIDIFEDKYSNVWFATPSGLNKLNKSNYTFTNYYKEDGLAANYCQAILNDTEGNLWVSTNSGLSKISIFKNEVLDFQNYDNRDGIVSNTFIRRSAFSSENGNLYFGSRDGLVYFNPKNIKSNTFLPPVYITDLYVNNKRIKPFDKTQILSENISFTKKLKLKYNQSDIAFEFAALNYVVPGKNQYRYKLNGFDKDWVDLNYGSRAIYTNIPYGKYSFEVIASNNSDLWNTEGAKIDILIHPPWYRTKVAYLAYLTLLFLLILSYRYFIVAQTQLEGKLKLERIEKENLNNLNKIKTRFFTNISHEFLTPLSLIISPLDSLINSGETLQNNIKSIYRNAKRLQRLINQMLDISKIEADHLDLKVSKGNLNNFAYDIFIAFKSMADNKKILFQYESNIEKDLVYFDADKIEKIVYNLVSNAIKFTPANGTVTVNLSKNNNYLFFRVNDSGIGIEAEEKEKIFESFYRAKNSKQKNIIGSGVGLSLVNGLVNIYGGEIEIDSELNKGTCISIRLPYLESQFSRETISKTEIEVNTSLDILDDFTETPTIESQANKDDKMWPTVLVVEDNEELNSHITELLNNRYKIHRAYNGKEGFDIAQNEIPDLIITDIVMPVLDGIEFLKLVRRNETTSHIPVIMLSAKVEVEDKIAGLELGADAYITKPFNQKHLETNIVNLINSRENLKRIYKKNVVIAPSEVNITSIDEKFIQKAISIVEENMSNPEFTVEIMAQEIGMSRVQLHRKLTGLLDMSASNFIRDLKIKRAAELLTKGQLTVLEVMYEVNMKSRAYFTKCFKEKYDMLPTEFVKANKGGK